MICIHTVVHSWSAFSWLRSISSHENNVDLFFLIVMGIWINFLFWAIINNAAVHILIYVFLVHIGVYFCWLYISGSHCEGLDDFWP